jgi:hypothetical protein
LAAFVWAYWVVKWKRKSLTNIPLRALSRT